jgi:hypothetical protein
MLPAVLIYFTLNLALTTWIWGVEAGQIFEGTREGGEKVRDRFSLLFVFYKSSIKVLKCLNAVNAVIFA